MFSFKDRDESVRFISRNGVDVVIVGAGAVGCSIAAHLAFIGIQCAVLEKEDLAAGASGNSTGLAHAGLRYLAQGRFLYVLHESLERQRLQELAPQYVRPFEFIYPVYRNDPIGFTTVRLGTRMYDAMARFQSWWRGTVASRNTQVLSAKEVRLRVPGLQSDGLCGATEYSVDAQLQDSRFTLGFAQQAHRHGSNIVTHARVRSVKPGTAGKQKLLCDDLLTNTPFEVHAKLVINATGAWIDELRSSSQRIESSYVQQSQGIHLVIDRVSNIPLIFSAAQKGRVFFVLPYGRDASVVGTTETPVVGLVDDVRPHAQEIQELLEGLFRFFPTLKTPDFENRGIRSIYWGVRPLLSQRRLSIKASREHRVIKEAKNFWAVVGVKLTASRAVGEEVAKKVAQFFDKKISQEIYLPCLPGGEFKSYLSFIAEFTVSLRRYDLADDTIVYLLERYGTHAIGVAALAKENIKLQQRILAEEPWIYAEILYGIQQELVLTLNDLLWRRTKWALFHDLSAEVIAQIVAVMSSALLWSEERQKNEIIAYERAVKLHRYNLTRQSV